MLGFPDPWIFAGFILSFIAALFCVIYGIISWHEGTMEKDGDYREDLRWEREEIDLIEKLP